MDQKAHVIDGGFGSDKVADYLFNGFYLKSTVFDQGNCYVPDIYTIGGSFFDPLGLNDFSRNHPLRKNLECFRQKNGYKNKDKKIYLAHDGSPGLFVGN